MSPPALEVRTGSFVRTPGLGVGRLAGVKDGIARVRYFTAPGHSPYVEREHPLTDISPAALRSHTRVYIHDGRRWRIGRVDGDPDERGRYVIAFPNSKGAVLSVEAFDVRWDVAIDDPFLVLESVGGDSPIVYESRLDFLREWAAQKAVATGVEGLLLGSVELHRHQLAVVRRVANDEVKRYLLADEVGLGKTVESSALVWQFLAKHPTGRVLVLVPEHLRHQWAAELLERFRTDRFRDAGVQIRSHTDQARWPTHPVDLLVIDEAHRVTRTGSLPSRSRERIAEIAHSAEELLLLSATPVRSNEAGFLDLLYLLDPEHYHPDQFEDFARKVELRDRLALTCQALTPEIDALDLSLYADELTNIFPDDRLLAEVLSHALSADDAARPVAVIRLRQHLSETYRLHRRLLRTRRTPEVLADFSVRGRERAVPFMVRVADRSERLRTDLLDRLRFHLLAGVQTNELTLADAAEVFREVAQRCGSLSDTLLPLVALEDSDQPAQVETFRDLVRRGVLPDLNSLICDIHSGHDAVLGALVDALARFTVTHTHRRTVLASAFTETAQIVAREMVRRWGHNRIATHLKTNSEPDNDAAITRWNRDSSCSVLVVDAGAEEGVNLQRADLLMHLDLPWESFRIEQRIGRCDRHATTTRGPIESMVVALGDQAFAMGWLEFLADGCGAFTRSLSSLQYVLSDIEREVQLAALREGSEALSDSVTEQSEKLAAEQIRIVAHDSLDAIDDSTTNADRSVDERLIESDQRRGLTGALATWLEGVGATLSWESPDVVRIGRRPRPQVPLDLEIEIARHTETPVAVARQASVERCLPILRAGHSMVDAVANHLLRDDRGVAFAMFRQRPEIWPPHIVFRTDFLVSAAMDDHLSGQADVVDLRYWIDQAVTDLLPPLVETVVITADGREVTDPRLWRRYDQQRGDLNLTSRPDVFQQLTATLDWKATCGAAAHRAREIFQQRASIVDRPTRAADQLKTMIARRADRSRARQIAGLPDSDVDLTNLLAAVPAQFPQRVDALGCGVIFVGDSTKLVTS